MYDPDIHQRRSIRLKDYDYSQAGAYFVTVCAWRKENMFGEISEGKVSYSDVGEIISDVWRKLPDRFASIELDEFVIMPNHIHGIIVLNVGAGPCACPDSITGQPQGVAPTKLSLPDAVHRYKSFTTAEYRIGVAQLDWMPFHGKLWQRNYYEHIIRDEGEMHSIREYIRCNPLGWDQDDENPESLR